MYLLTLKLIYYFLLPLSTQFVQAESIQQQVLIRSISSSFISQNEQRKVWHEQSIAALTSICKTFTFLKCIGTMKYGSFGVGITIELLNNPSYGIRLYRNCRGMAENPTQPNFSQNCTVSPMEEPRLRAFLKILKRDAEDANRYAFLSNISAFDKEVRRTREFALLTGPSGLSFGASILDIRDLSTGLVKHLHKTAFLQEHIPGITAFEVLQGLRNGEFVMMTQNLDQLCSDFEKYQKALNTVEGEKLMEEFKKSVISFQKELWLRARLRVRLSWSIIAAARTLWDAGILHCDLHWGNMMILETHIKTEEEFQNLMGLGLVFVPTPAVLHSFKTTVSQDVSSYLSQHPEGILGYNLNPTQIRFIDISYALKVHAILSKLSGIRVGQYGVQAEKKLQHPCRAYRSERNEDLLEIFSGGTSGEGLASVFNITSPQSFGNQWRKVLQTAKSSSNSCSKRFFDTIQGKNHDVGALALTSLQRDVGDIDHLFHDILQSMLKVPEYITCAATAKAWDVVPGKQRSGAVLSVKPHETIQQILPQLSCSFYDIRQGGLRFQRNIEKATIEFPQFTSLVLGP